MDDELRIFFWVPEVEGGESIPVVLQIINIGKGCNYSDYPVLIISLIFLLFLQQFHFHA